MRFVVEANRGLVQPALTLDPDVVGAVDHDLGHAVVRQRPLERPVAKDVVRDLGAEPRAVRSGKPGFLREVCLDV